MEAWNKEEKAEAQVQVRRGAFDFETYGWNIEEGQTETAVNPLCCYLAWGVKGERTEATEAFVHDSKQKNPQAVAPLVLLTMLERPEVGEWWAHNMGRFDGLFLVAAAQRMGWGIDSRLAGGGRIICHTFIAHTGQQINVFDSYNVCPNSLRSIAEDFQLPSKKLFSEDDYKGDMRECPVEKLKAGCRTDCILILELLDALEGLVDAWGGHLKRTFAATSLSIVSHHISRRGLKLPDFSKRETAWVNKIVDPARYGGRTEVIHHLPSHLLKEFDVCSSYPASMRGKMPWEFLGKVEGNELLHAYDMGNPLICLATVRVPEMDLPPLPFRSNEDDKEIFFPTGKWTGAFVAEELRYAEELGCDITLHDGLLFGEAEPFTEFVEEVYETKRTSKGAKKIFAKLLLNGCYGKFGESPEHQELKVFDSGGEGVDFILNNPGKVTDYFEDPQFLFVNRFNWSRQAHYAIAATITARSRILLHQNARKTTGLAYMDTDSLKCKSWRGIPSDELGGFKLEKELFRGLYFAPKVYRELLVDGKKVHHSKGFPVSEESFDAMWKSGTERQKEREERTAVKVERIRSLRAQLKKRGSVVARERLWKVWNGLSMKRRPLSDGSTEPWRVRDILNGMQKEAYSPVLELWQEDDMPKSRHGTPLGLEE